MPTPSENIITVVFNIDNNYVMPMAVALRSAAEQLSEDFTLHAVILEQGVTQESKALVKESMQGLKVDVVWHAVSLPEGVFTLQSHPGGVCATYFKLYMAEAIPNDIERAIYLDADIIVRRDLSELWTLDLQGYAIAAVADTRWQAERMRAINITDVPFTRDSDYFNCSVFIADLKQWRQLDIIKRASFYADAYRKDLWLVDQDLLNCIFSNAYKLLPPQWNVLEFYTDVYSKYWPLMSAAYTTQELRSAATAPAIMHYSGLEKPWNGATSVHERIPFVECYNRTHWASKPLPASDIKQHDPLIKHQRMLTPMLKVLYREAETGRFRASILNDIGRYLLRHPKALIIMPRIVLPNLYWGIRSHIVPRLHRKAT